MGTKNKQDKIDLSLALQKIGARYDRHSNSYSISTSYVDTSNLNEPVKTTLNLYPLRKDHEDLKLISNEVIIGILKEGKVIMAKVILYDEKNNKLALLIAKPKKHLFFFSLKVFIGLYHVPIWKDIKEIKSNRTLPKGTNINPPKKKKIKEDTLPNLFT